MHQRRQALPQSRYALNVNLRHHDALTLRLVREHFTPWINDHAVPPSAAATLVQAPLRRRNHVSLVFNRTGA